MKFYSFLLIVFTFFMSTAQGRLDKNPNTYKFKYKTEIFKGSRGEISAKLRSIKNDERFSGIPSEIQLVINKLYKKAIEQPIRKRYKRKAIIFLDALYDYEEFALMYNNKLSYTINALKKDMKRLDFKFEREFTKAKIKLDRAKNESDLVSASIEELTKDMHNCQLKLISHRWMKKKFDTYDGIVMVKTPDALVKEFKKNEAMAVYKMYENNETEKIASFLINEMIAFFHSKAIIEMDLEQLDLNYITRL